jgi:hypothetical protein
MYPFDPRAALLAKHASAGRTASAAALKLYKAVVAKLVTGVLA